MRPTQQQGQPSIVNHGTVFLLLRPNLNVDPIIELSKAFDIAAATLSSKNKQVIAILFSRSASFAEVVVRSLEWMQRRGQKRAFSSC
jgi:hypothetical protein